MTDSELEPEEITPERIADITLGIEIGKQLAGQISDKKDCDDADPWNGEYQSRLRDEES